MLNHKKIILVGFISAFVALLTSFLGVTGTIIGSVISSVLYNVLSEALEKPLENATLNTNFEWEIAYIFPLVVIALIQLLLIFAILSEWGLLHHTFLNLYLSIQEIADYNLYRVLGLALIVMSVYPIVLKPDIIKKSYGMIIAFVGLIFLARGFVDVGNVITELYKPVFKYFDFPIAVIALILLLFVIYKILLAKNLDKELKVVKEDVKEDSFSNNKKFKTSHSNKHDDFKRKPKKDEVHIKNHEVINKPRSNHNVSFKSHINEKKQDAGINRSSSKIQFESNDILDDYKK